MAINPGEGVTPIGHVPADIVQPFLPGRGYVHVHVVDVQGRVAVQVGRSYAFLDRQEAELLRDALGGAVGRLDRADVDAAALQHARQAVEGLGLTWPA